MSDTAVQVQDAQDALSYELLLTKFSGEEEGCDCRRLASRTTFDDASTADPEGSRSACSVAGTERGQDANKRQLVPSAPAKDGTVVLHNVSPGPGLDASLQSLLKEVRAMSEEAFNEDCLPDITKKSKWQLTLLASSDRAVLYGFLVAKVRDGCLSIAKLAVAPDFRGQGLGKRFMDEVMRAAKKRGDVYEACLSSRSTAVKFYQRLGFKADTNIKLKVDFEVEEGQVYMEKKLRQRPRRQK